MHPLISALKKTIQKYGMLTPGDKVVVGVSGGADSLALLHSLSEIRAGLGLSLIVAHLDHGLRPGGEKEAAFVRRAARKMGAPFYYRKADVRAWREEKRLTIEEAARDLRYAFLLECARASGASRIALGHTADDQAESVLMRLLRGSGTRGLSGIPPVRDGIFIRPLIEVTRAEVESFLRERKAAFLHDPSNDSDQYLRNRVRHELLPLLRRYNPRIRQSLVQMADLFREEEGFWREHLEEVFPRIARAGTRGKLVLDIPSLAAQPRPVRLRCFRLAVEKIKGNLLRMSLAHFLAMESLVLSRGPNKSLRLPGGLSVTKAYQDLTFAGGGEKAAPFAYPVAAPGYVEIREIGKGMEFQVEPRGKKALRKDSPTVARLDFDTLSFPLTLRSFRPGDRLQPLGMAGNKKVKDLFIDCKIPACRRKQIPILCKGDRILWVAGVRMDHRARVKPGTKKILRVELL